MGFGDRVTARARIAHTREGIAAVGGRGGRASGRRADINPGRGIAGEGQGDAGDAGLARILDAIVAGIDIDDAGKGVGFLAEQVASAIHPHGERDAGNAGAAAAGAGGTAGGGSTVGIIDWLGFRQGIAGAIAGGQTGEAVGAIRGRAGHATGDDAADIGTAGRGAGQGKGDAGDAGVGAGVAAVVIDVVVDATREAGAVFAKVVSAAGTAQGQDDAAEVVVVGRAGGGQAAAQLFKAISIVVQRRRRL